MPGWRRTSRRYTAPRPASKFGPGSAQGQQQRLIGSSPAAPQRGGDAGGPVCQGKTFNKIEEIITPDKKSAGLRFGKASHIVWPWHGYEYDLLTGAHLGDPSLRLTPVKVTVREGQIYISVPT